MSKNYLSFLSSSFLIIPAIAALLPPWQPAAPAPPPPPSLLRDHVQALIKDTRAQKRGKWLNLRITLIERGGRQQLTGHRKTDMELMMETVGGKRRMLSFL